jgi:glycosyltransferase involved in cell wall biosynthesis
VTKLSIISPCYNERQSLRPLHAEIAETLDSAGIDWEWIVVDDHSSDGSFEVISELSRSDPRVRGIRLGGNFGSHIAMFCGLDFASGECAAVLTADLEDPPSVLVELVKKWSEGHKVVWASRDERQRAGWLHHVMARFYYLILRRVIAIQQMPKNGADFFLIDRTALELMRGYRDRNISIFSLVGWLDFPHTTVSFEKRKRRFGSSKWSLGRRAKLFADTITGFSHFPIRAMSVIGALCAALGFLYAIYVTVEYMIVQVPPGWTSIAVLVLVLGGLQMLMLGVLGEYFARMLDEVRPRPRYIIERMSSTLTSPIADDALLLTPRQRRDEPAPISKASAMAGEPGE